MSQVTSNPITSTFLQPPAPLVGGADGGAGGCSDASASSSTVQALASLLEGLGDLVEQLAGEGAGGAAGGTNGAATNGAGSGAPGGLGGNSGGAAGGGAATAGADGTQPAAGGAAAGAAGEGLRDIKLNTRAGGDALQLQIDNQGNLYNHDGNSVGVLNKDGSVTLNSGATDEMWALDSGGAMFAASHDGQVGAGGSVTWDASDVTVSTGDLPKK